MAEFFGLDFKDGFVLAKSVFNQLGPKHIAAETSGNQPETSL
jgi:hypothetical protein